MVESLRLPIPELLTAEYVVVDPRNSAAPPVSSEQPDEPRVEWIGPDHAVLPPPALLAGGGADPRSLSRVYDAARHLLVTVRAAGALGPLGGGERPGVATAVTAHVDQARAVAWRLARQSGGLLLDPMLALFPDPVSADPVSADPVSADPVSGGRDTTGEEGLWWRRHLRIGAIGEGPGLAMFTMGLTRLGLPELRTLGLPPFLAPAWARLLQAAALLLLTRPPGRASADVGTGTGTGTGTGDVNAGAGSDQGRPVWLLPDEIAVSAVNDGTGVEARLGLRSAPGASPPHLVVVPPREFAGTEAEWRIELVHRLFPAARI